MNTWNFHRYQFWNELVINYIYHTLASLYIKRSHKNQEPTHPHIQEFRKNKVKAIIHMSMTHVGPVLGSSVFGVDRILAQLT